LRVLGGAMARVPADATAFAHRDAKIMANLAVFFEGADDQARRTAWVTEFAAALDQGDASAYANFLGDDISRYQSGDGGSLQLISGVAASFGQSQSPIDLAITNDGQFIYQLATGSAQDEQHLEHDVTDAALLRDRPPQDGLGTAEAVKLRCVDQRDPFVQGSLDDRGRLRAGIVVAVAPLP